MPYAKLSRVCLRWCRWCANKFRAVTGTRKGQSRCSVVISLIAATALLLTLYLVTWGHEQGKQKYTTCSLGYWMEDDFTAQNGPGTYIGDKLVSKAPLIGDFNITDLPSRRLYKLSTNASRADPDTVAVECWFTRIDLAFTTAELTCMATVWGKYAKQPSLGRVNLPNNSTLVVSVNGAEAMVLNDTDTPCIAVTSVELYAGPSGVSAYPELHLPFQVLVSVFLQSSTNDTRGGNFSHVYAALGHGFIVWLWLSHMPMYQVSNGFCARVLHRNYTVVLTGEIILDTLSYQLLVAMNVMMWCVSFADFVLTVMLYLSHGEAPIDAKTLLSFSATLLFALPTMRAIWPAAPPSSTRLDVMNIFAQLTLVSFAVIAQLLYLTLRQPAGSTVVDARQLLPKATVSGRQPARDSLPVTRDSSARRQLTVARSEHGAQASLDHSMTFEI